MANKQSAIKEKNRRMYGLLKREVYTRREMRSWFKLCWSGKSCWLLCLWYMLFGVQRKWKRHILRLHKCHECFWFTFEALNPSISSMIRCKSSFCGPLSSRWVTMTWSVSCSLLLSEGAVVFSRAGWVEQLLPSDQVCSSSLLVSPFFFTCQESSTYNNGRVLQHSKG